MTKRVNQYLELIESQKRISGRAGYYSFTIFVVVALYSHLVPDYLYFHPVYFYPIYFAFAAVPILAIMSLFQAGEGGKLIGIFSIFILIASVLIPSLIYYPSTHGIWDITRLKVSDGFIDSGNAKIAASEFYQVNNRFPSSFQEVGLEEPTEYSINVDRVELGEDGVITITYKIPGLEGQSLVLKPTGTDDGIVMWECKSNFKSTLPDRVTPTSCR